MADPDPEPDPADLRMAYQHHADFTATFFDWRHRVMTFSFTAVSALGALAAFMWNHDLQPLAAGPLYIAALLTWCSITFDQRNQEILTRCHHEARRIAERLRLTGHVPASWLESTRPNERATYYGRLRLVYSILTAAALLLGTAALVVGTLHGVKG